MYSYLLYLICKPQSSYKVLNIKLYNYNIMKFTKTKKADKVAILFTSFALPVVGQM